MKWLTTDDLNHAILKSKQQELDRWRTVSRLKAFRQLTSEPANTHQLWHDGYLAGLKEARRIIEYLARNKYIHTYRTDYDYNVDTNLSLEENLLNVLATNEDEYSDVLFKRPTDPKFLIKDEDLQPTEFLDEVEIALQKAYEDLMGNTAIYPEVDVLSKISELKENGLSYEYKDEKEND